MTIDSQEFALNIDTGSATTLVASSLCTNCGVSPEWSTGSGTETGTPINMTFGSGGNVMAKGYQDVVQVGSQTPLVQMDFGGITSQTGYFNTGSCLNPSSGLAAAQGTLGLGPIDLSTIGTAAPDTYFSALLAASPALPDVFAIHLCTSNGNLWFGGYDTSFANGPVVYTPMLSMSSGQPYYELNIVSFGLGATNYGSSAANVEVDTGTGQFLIPTAVYNSMVSTLGTNAGANSIFGSGALGASYFNGNTCITTKAGQSQTQVDAALPPMTVTLTVTTGGTFKLSMPASQSYLVLMGGQYCPAIVPDSASGGQDFWGASALRAYITVFGSQNKQIGFVPQIACK